MKKTLLLAGVASIFALNAQAMSWNINEYRPYVGADYSFFKAKQGNQAKNMKKYFHSGKANVGMQLYENWDLEFSYQQSGEIKGRTLEGKRGKNYFSVYALDAYGKYPMFCSNFSLLGTVGAGIYHAKYKNFPKTSYNKVGYRAGVGLQYDFNKNWGARVVGRYSYIGSGYTNNFREVTAGLQYRF